MKIIRYKTKILSLIILCLLSENLLAQVSLGQETIGLVTKNNGTSARMKAMGGIGVSLGGDLGAALVNPAGLGFYRTSEFVFSPELTFYDSKVNYLNSTSDNNDSQFRIANFGLVIRTPEDPYSKSAWHGGSISISHSLSQNYRNSVSYFGQNTKNDILDSYKEEANWIGIGNLGNNPGRYAGYAYDIYLLDVFDDSDDPGTEFYDRLIDTPPTAEHPTLQSKTIETKGTNRNWNFSYGGNLKDQWFLGAGINLQVIDYTKTVDYKESYSASDLLSHHLIEKSKINGFGTSFTIGAIYKPVNTLNIGFSYTTPTYYSLDYQEDFFMGARFDNYKLNDGTILSMEDTLLLYDSKRNIKSPSKMNLGATFFFNKKGFLSADIEYLNYSNTEVTIRNDNTQDINNSISSNYKSVVNLKLGGEYRLNALRFRGGYALYPSPEKSNERRTKVKHNLHQISAGIGLKRKMWFVDLALVQSLQKTNNEAYELNTQGAAPVASIDNSNLNVSFTVGFKL